MLGVLHQKYAVCPSFDLFFYIGSLFKMYCKRTSKCEWALKAFTTCYCSYNLLGTEQGPGIKTKAEVILTFSVLFSSQSKNVGKFDCKAQLKGQSHFCISCTYVAYFRPDDYLKFCLSNLYTKGNFSAQYSFQYFLVKYKRWACLA